MAEEQAVAGDVGGAAARDDAVGTGGRPRRWSRRPATARPDRPVGVLGPGSRRPPPLERPVVPFHLVGVGHGRAVPGEVPPSSAARDSGLVRTRLNGCP